MCNSKNDSRGCCNRNSLEQTQGTGAGTGTVVDTTASGTGTPFSPTCTSISSSTCMGKNMNMHMNMKATTSTNSIIIQSRTRCSRSKSRSGSRARSRIRSRSSKNYSSLHAAAIFLLLSSQEAKASRHHHQHHHHLQRGQSYSTAFVSRFNHEELCKCKRTILGDPESARGFRSGSGSVFSHAHVHRHSATLMETNVNVADTDTYTDTEIDADILWKEKKAKLKSSIKYKHIAVSINQLQHQHKTNTNTNQRMEQDRLMKITKERVESFTRDRKVQLTTAINKVWKLDTEKRRSGKNGYGSGSRTMIGANNLAGSEPERQIIAPPPPSKKLTIRNLWKRRHAQSIEEGIRRERVFEPETTGQQLSEILDETRSDDVAQGGGVKKKNRRYAARTITGLINALAEEATGLEVEVDARNDTPLWKKQIDAVEINFSRLGVQALRMGGLDEALMDMNEELTTTEKESMADSIESEAKKAYNEIDLMEGSPPSRSSSDEIFDRIDVDNSGALDKEELTHALTIASGISNPGGYKNPSPALSKLVSRLINIYDTNGDGVVDREEYRKLVEDMSEVRNIQRMKQKARNEKRQEQLERKGGFHPLKWVRTLNHALQRRSNKAINTDNVRTSTSPVNSASNVNVQNFDLPTNDSIGSILEDNDNGVDFEGAQDISDDPSVMNTITKGEGSIILSDLKLDLRRLLFGAVPFVKRITPGGPLILEPFTMSLKASFTKEDILESGLLDDGLRRLVARALRRRVRSVRDLLDGAIFYGTKWNMASREAPVVDVLKLIDIEFDTKDRLIITGRAKIRAKQDQPFVENSFKLRTKLGTRENGQYIRLEEPELALIIECPKAWERNIVSTCKNFNWPIPERPEPLYKFIPLVSPIKKTEQDGFNLGDDNRIQAIYAKDNALRFEMSSVLRPGRFLGNHYLAFTLPNRTFIITMDRIKELYRTARKNKREMERSKRELELSKKKQASERYNRAVAQALASKSSSAVGSNVENIDLSYKKELDEDHSFLDRSDNSIPTSPVAESEIVANNRPGFFGRFLEGYLEAAREETEKERDERLTTAISEFFSPADDENDVSEEVNFVPPRQTEVN